jgi:hypothetical protein
MTIFSKLGKRDKIVHEKDSFIIKLSTKEIKEWYSSIKKPLVQSFIIDDKVNDINTLLNDNNNLSHHSLSCRLITIAHISIGDEQEYYLVDGQHRVNATIKLYDNSNGEYNKIFLASIIKVSDESEMNQLFEKTIDNALNRFKTPVVTPEVLFITLMEERTSKAGKIIKKVLKTDAPPPHL